MLLHAAACGGYFEVVELLLQRGIDVNATDNVRVSCHCDNVRELNILLPYGRADI
jgi:ankyrin repeat protein